MKATLSWKLSGVRHTTTVLSSIDDPDDIDFQEVFLDQELDNLGANCIEEDEDRMMVRHYGTLYMDFAPEMDLD